MKPMPPRVVHFYPLPSATSSGLAGPARSLQAIVSEQHRQKRAGVVLFDPGPLQSWLEKHGIPHLVAFPSGPPRSTIGRFVACYAALTKLARDIDADVFHIQSGSGNRLAWASGKRLRIPIITHQRDNYMADRFHRGLALATHIIAISDWVRSTLPESLHNRTTVVPNAVSVPDISDRQKSETLRVGFAGRFVEDKGIDILVDAIGPLLDRSDVSVRLLGAPPHPTPFLDDLRARIDKWPVGHRSRISIEPFAEDVGTFYRSIDVLAVPSRFREPFGRVAIEGMAHGCVVVAANHGGLPEIIDDGRTGLLFKPGDSLDLRCKIESLLTDRASISRIAHAGREKAASSFDVENHLKQIDQVYERVLGSV